MQERNTNQAMINGFKTKCPNCGKGSLYSSYLKVKPNCSECNEDYSEARADDFPPYLTIIVVGHIIVPLVLWLERSFQPVMWVQMAIWLPMTAILSLILLPPIKGAVVGLQWGARMGGFKLPAKP